VRMRAGVLVRWRTASELRVSGFNVYRESNGARVKLNRSLIPSAGATVGHAYSFVDRHAPHAAGLRYWVQEVRVSGARRWYGPINAS
jgi:hypothetical protein